MSLKSHIRFFALIAFAVLISGCAGNVNKVISDYLDSHPAAAEIVVIPDDILQTDDRHDVYVKMVRVLIDDIELDDQNRLYLDVTPKQFVRKYGLDERYYDFLVNGLKEGNESIAQFGSAMTSEMLEEAKQEILSFKKAQD